MDSVRDKNPDRNEHGEIDLTPVLALAVSAYGATGSLPAAAAIALVALTASRVRIG